MPGKNGKKKPEPRKARSYRNGSKEKTAVRYFPTKRMTKEIKEQLVYILSRRFVLGDACTAVGISYETFRLHRKNDPEFAKAVEEAKVHYKSMIEGTLNDRAINGWQEPVWGNVTQIVQDEDGNVHKETKQKIIGHVTKFDNKLLLELARRHVPEYRPQFKVEQKTEHSGFVNTDVSLAELSKEGRQELRMLLNREKERRQEQASNGTGKTA